MADKPAEHPIGQLVQVFIIQGRGIVPLDAAVVLHPLKQQQSACSNIWRAALRLKEIRFLRSLMAL